MNPLEQQLQYPSGDAMPEPGGSMELAPGVRWVRMPLPFVLDHVNLWLLRDRIGRRLVRWLHRHHQAHLAELAAERGQRPGESP